MTTDMLPLVAAIGLISSLGFVIVAGFWLRKMRDTVSTALAEAAGQQIRTAQRLAESIALIQKQQDNYNRQLQILAQAGLRLQQELNHVSTRLGNAQNDNERGSQTLH